ncbi:MAG TPA: beta-ketoacyl-ACP synthase II [Spirochaetia bacterium]|nr:beta-ketoacyl-ACP synthase II [Spirochaetia bacterium]
MRKHVVVTGIGSINPVGLTVRQTWENLLAGKSGIGKIQAFDPEEWQLKAQIAGEATDFDPTLFMDGKEARKLDRFSQMALGAAIEAVEQSGLKIEGDLRHEVGTIIASGIGGAITLVNQAQVLLEKGARRVNPFTVPMLMPNAASGVVSIRFGALGPSFATVSACASAADAIGSALDMIRSGRAKVMITGGSEAAILPICIAGFEQAHALCIDSNDAPEKASRPFDATRSGFVLAEGAGILILEEEEFARSRGAHILAELAGWGSAADGYHITAPEPEGDGGTRAVKACLANGEVEMSEVVYINAHGTSTQLNDKVESLIIKKVFGEQAYKIPVSSTKSMTGHLGGAAGAFEAVVVVKTLETGWAPPTINYKNVDPECDLDYIPGKAREIGKGVVLSNSFGFGGHSSCLAFRSYEGT